MEAFLVKKIIDYIKHGKIVSFPTETVYALSCDANNYEAINKIYEIKDRSKNKLFSVFINIDYIDNYVIYNNKFREYIFDELNNGTTIIFNKKNNNVLQNINSNTIGIRYPKHQFTRKLLKECNDMVLIATSVNKSGEKELCCYKDIINNFNNIDFILDNELLTNSIISGKPSKIISLVNDNIDIIRE